MESKRILICGDSFSADWTKKYHDRLGWPNHLADKYHVTNLSQAGCSQYRIYQQIIGQDLNAYHAIIVSHTSPYRIYVPDHPIHSKDSLHANSDLIYSDVKEHADQYPQLKSLVDYFEQWFDLDHARFVHGLICEKIESILDQSGRPCLHLVNLDWHDLHKFNNMIDLHDLFRREPGLINHYSDRANFEIFEKIDDFLCRVI